MTPEAYLKQVLRSAAPHHLEPNDKTILLGLRGETGEVADLVKKAIGHRQGWAPYEKNGKTIDPRANMIKELGDCSWYGAAQLHRMSSTNVMNVTTIEFTDDLETLADMLCDAGARLGHAYAGWEAADAGLEFFAIIQELGRRMSPPVSIQEIWETNAAKLSVRYPDGFNTEASKAKADESPKAFFQIDSSGVTPEMIERLKNQKPQPITLTTVLEPCDGSNCGHPCDKCGANYGDKCDGGEEPGDRCPGSVRACSCVKPKAQATPMERAFKAATLSGEHKARHGCLGVPEVDDYATAGNGYRAPCDTCDHPHHLTVKPE